VLVIALTENRMNISNVVGSHQDDHGVRQLHPLCHNVTGVRRATACTRGGIAPLNHSQIKSPQQGDEGISCRMITAVNKEDPAAKRNRWTY
jgi:hypothetical protein